MFDPPDYPYKDLSDTLRAYGSDELLFENDSTVLSSVRNLEDTSNSNLKLHEKEKSFHQNNEGRYFTTETITLTNTNAANTGTNPELLVIQSENNLNDLPTLLDDNTVNQFLLPVQVNLTEKKVRLTPILFVR